MHLAHIDINFPPGGGATCQSEKRRAGQYFCRKSAYAKKKTRHKARGKACVACRNMIFICRFGGKALHRVNANSSVTFMLSPVRGMVTGGCGVGIIEDGELCWPPPDHTTICCNFGEPDGYGFADKVSLKSLLMLPAQPFVIILYLHNEITKKILKRFCGNAIIHIILIGINCSKTLLTT